MAEALEAMQERQRALFAEFARARARTASESTQLGYLEEGFPGELVDIASEGDTPPLDPESVFASENTDPKRAESLERSLVDAFAQWELAGTQLNNIECRSTTCRLEVDYAGAAPDELQELELASAFAKAFGGPVHISSASNGATGHVLYATAINR